MLWLLTSQCILVTACTRHAVLVQLMTGLDCQCECDCRYCHVVKRSQGYRAYVLVDQKQVHLGFYPVEEDAARATDTARLYLV